ncbi:uncharacterized protein LOC133286090 isoform X1 [Gastrolobium bilobum]|uniref:uncharacterized protein LOC133286090 isoform X1 n=1 Tax=Gastrolobium bilobum TaxID=150636 RepID=UPI002AB18660|nr:uncharacterized protein LOC133286090 isoform X1 [Gastrolobium bilobum]
MDLKVKRINWVGNIYQKFEAVCQEVDDIVGQDAVKYLGNQVQNVGDSMKKFYSGVVHELLPFPTSPSSTKHEAHSVALKNNIGSSVKSVAGVKDINKKGDEENPVNNFIESLKGSNKIDLANDQQAGGPIKHDLVNQVCDETCSDSLDVEDSYITQDVGDSVKKFYSGVVPELLPFPTLVSSTKYEAHSEDLENNIGSSVKSVAGVKDINNEGDQESPVSNFIESLQDSNVIDQQACVPIKHDLVNHVSDETSSDSLEVEDSYVTQEAVGDDSRETCGAKNENLHVSIEEIAVESAPKLMILISVKEKEPLEFSIHNESYSDSSGSGCGVLLKTKDNIDLNAEQNSCLIVEENALSSSSSEVLNFTSLGEKESTKVSLFSKLSDAFDKDTCGILAEDSPAASVVSCKRPPMMEPLCFKSSFEIESCRNNSGDFASYISDSSAVHVCCEPSLHVSGQIMESQGGLVSSGCCQSMQSKDESLVSSIDLSLEDIQLNNDAKLEESCVFVDDSELRAVSYRAQKLRSYRKRIQDAFASKKRLAKEYEQLAIWYGDTDIELSQGLSQTLFPFSSRTCVDSKDLQVQHASESEWELL